jgi:hypothetical protein
VERQGTVATKGNSRGAKTSSKAPITKADWFQGPDHAPDLNDASRFDELRAVKA